MKVAILGMAPGWKDAESLDSAWDIWGLNDGYRVWCPVEDAPLAKRFTRWFELHGNTPLTRARRQPEHWDALAALQIPVYTLYDLPGLTTMRRFPIEDVAAIRDYFSCTFCYQIGLALLEGATHIHLYGVPLTGAREALVERPCTEWWLGYAEGKGVEVKVIHDEDYGLGKQAYRYAFNDQAERYLAYRFAYQHHDDVDRWIHYEEMRLRVHRPWWEKYARRLLAWGVAR